MLNEQAKQLLDAPGITLTQQGVDSYPRVLRNEDRDDGAMLVTFAMPGLRRVRAWVPETQWVNGDHLSMHPAMAAQLSRVAPPVNHADDPHREANGE